jgi:hypothetical protein
MKIKLLLIIGGLLLALQVFGQYTSKDNHQGDWNDGGTWVGNYYETETIQDDYVVIDGQVAWNPEPYGDSTLNFNLKGNAFGPNNAALIVRDTLIVYGNLDFANDHNLEIREGGMLIVYGDLSGTNKIELDPKGYLIIAGDLLLNPSDQQEITTDGSNVYIGGETSNCPDGECNYTGNDSTDLVGDSVDVYDYYQGQDPANQGQFSIRPQSTDICSRTPQQVNLYFTDIDSVDALYWQISEDGVNYTDTSGTSGKESITVTSTQNRYYRVQYSTDNGSTFVPSDSAVVYCNQLCNFSVSMDLTSGATPDCYYEAIGYEFTANQTKGTSPYSYDWSISPDTSSQGGAIHFSPNANPVVFDNFTNPATVSQDYIMKVIVTDDQGCIDSTSQTVTMHRRPVTGNSYHVPNEYDQQ